MVRFFPIAAITLLTTIGCAPEESKGNSNSSSASGEITAANAQYYASLPFEFGNLTSTIKVSGQETGLAYENSQETIDCSNGEVSVNTVVNSFESNGSLIDATITRTNEYTNCQPTTNLMNGTAVDVLVYSDYDAMNFDGTYSLTTTYDDFLVDEQSSKITLNGEFQVLTNYDTSTMTSTWDVSFVSTMTNNLTLTSKSETPLVFDYQSEIYTSGKWSSTDNNGTTLTAEVVANGVEFSIDGSQATLLEWSQVLP